MSVYLEQLPTSIDAEQHLASVTHKLCLALLADMGGATGGCGGIWDQGAVQ